MNGTPQGSDRRRHRVVILSPQLNAISGVTTHAKMLLASGLAEEFDLFHFSVGSEGRDESGALRLWRLAKSPLQLAAFLLRKRITVLHINTSLETKAYWRDLAHFLIAKALRKGVVNQIHGGALPKEMFGGSRVLTALLRRVLVKSDAVTVLSMHELEAYRDFDPRINVHLVPNAIDAAGLLGCNRAYNEREPLKLVYVGRLVRSKGLFEVMDALGRLKAAGSRFSLDVAGDGDDAEALKDMVRRAGLSDQVRFHGAVFGEAKARLWLASDVLVFPTYHREGLPYALLESMAAGCVPVTSPVAAIPDVIKDGENGVLIPSADPVALADAITALDRDRLRLTRMAEAARVRIRSNYTTARLARDFGTLYRSIS